MMFSFLEVAAFSAFFQSSKGSADVNFGKTGM